VKIKSCDSLMLTGMQLNKIKCLNLLVRNLNETLTANRDSLVVTTPKTKFLRFQLLESTFIRTTHIGGVVFFDRRKTSRSPRYKSIGWSIFPVDFSVGSNKKSTRWRRKLIYACFSLVLEFWPCNFDSCISNRPQMWAG
jgi:hypothetical protein